MKAKIKRQGGEIAYTKNRNGKRRGEHREDMDGIMFIFTESDMDRAPYKTWTNGRGQQRPSAVQGDTDTGWDRELGNTLPRRERGEGGGHWRGLATRGPRR